MAQTQFYYCYSADGLTWGSWTLIASASSPPYFTTFGYPAGYGYYEFYSVATDGLGATQGAPPTAQAFVHHDPQPDYTTAAYVTLGNLSQTYDGSPKAASLTTVPPGLTGAVTYNGNTTVPVHAGSYAVTANITQAGFTGTAGGTLSVAPASQAISFGPLGSVSTHSPSFALSGSASSGLTVAYTSSNPSVATISGNVVTVLAAGTTTITATQVGNSDVLPATPVVQSLVVTADVPANVPALGAGALLALALLLAAAGAARLSAPRRRREG